MKEAQQNPLHGSRARPKVSVGHLFLSLYLKGYHKTCSRASGSRSQGDEQSLHLAPPWEILFLMFPGEVRHFLPSTLMDMDLQSRERNLSGCLVESWVSGFTINLRIELTDAEGEELMQVMGVNEME